MYKEATVKHDKQNATDDRDMSYSTMAYLGDIKEPPPSGGRAWCCNQAFIKEQARKKTRCPSCSRILLLREVRCIGGEVVGFRYPLHKVKVKTTKRPSKIRKHSNRK